jgi:NAD-dependent DNA ligase
MSTLITKRINWLTAAQKYYMSDDSEMSDREWDQLGRELFANRQNFPECLILNDPDYYAGGSLYWVKKELYQQAFQVHTEGN